MHRMTHLVSKLIALFMVLALAACGGGESGTSNGPSSANSTNLVNSAASQQAALAQEPNAPQVTGNIAADSFNWMNYRRQQMGLPPVVRNQRLDTAAQGHSDYQSRNDTITHIQVAGKPGFTGETVLDRLTAAGYLLDQRHYGYGEVIAAVGNNSGFGAAEGLIDAIYHRFVIFEPVFKEAGVGVASVQNGYTYFTTKFAANGLGPGVGQGNVAVYPVPNQKNVETVFYSDREIPDPMPGQNEVGYPVSVHADGTATVTVQSFTLRPRGGATLPVLLITSATDPNVTSSSVAAILPYAVLSSKTTYDVQFVGTVNGSQVNRSWSFTTR